MSEVKKIREIRVWDMGEHTLYYADILEIMIKKFNIKQINRAKIAFSSLEELQKFSVPIDTSTIFLFDSKEHKEIDLSTTKIQGSSNIICSTSVKLLLNTKKFDEEFFFTSILNCGESLFSRINNNLNTKEFNFYHSIGTNMNDEQKNINLKVPATLIW